MIALRLEPVDTWQFGVGNPSQAGSASQLVRESAMPPAPSTVAGALRAALARSLGWDGRASWSPDLVPLLGDGPDDYGATRFAGPLLAMGDTLLAPLPATVRRRGDQLVVGLAPGPEVVCDLGPAVRLPAFLDQHGLGDARPGDEEVVGGFVPLPVAHALLAGSVVSRSELRRGEALWSLEHRIGIERARATRTVAAGALFQVTHVRPAPGSASALTVFATGDRAAWWKACGVTPLGAEGRLAHVTLVEGTDGALRPAPGALEEIAATGRATLALVSPGLLTGEQWRGAAPLDELGGARLACAVGPRPLRIGGWDGRRASPVAQQSYVAPSTVLFVEHPSGEALASALRELGDVPQIGSRTSAGYGVSLVGAWPVGSS